MTKPSEHDLDLDLDRFVQQNVLCCLSFMVATLASANGVTDVNSYTDLANLTEQAAELASPVDDYEEAARQAGWEPYTDKFGVACWRETSGDDMARTWAGDAEDVCREFDIEPYQWEVYEHWAVDSRFAEHLLAQGEKVDTDFAGLCVWARTTTGQAISMDGVITRIWNEIHKEG